jgi:TldD protein
VIGQDEAALVLRATLARGGESAELYLERASSTGLRLDDGRLDEAVSGVDQGAGLSLVDNDRTLYGNTNRIDPESLMRLADRLARAQGAVASGDAGGPPASPAGAAPPPAAPDVPAPFAPRALPLISPVSIPASTVPIERKVEVLRRADAAARAHDRRVTQVTVQYRDTEQHVTVADSDGTWGSEVRCFIVLHVTVVARDGAGIRTGMEARSETRGFEFFDRHLPEDIAREAARQAVQQLEARPAPAGTFTVVLSSKAGGTMVHEACGHGLEADFILKSMSVYSGKLGQQVASPLVTVVDDGTLANQRGSSCMDDEGIATTRAVLIEKGVLRGYLQSRRTARLLKMRPTGHGRRESYRHLPLPRMRNTLILPGEHDPDAILREVKEGILVCRMGGGEVDVASGNFVFSCTEAWMIRDGRVAEPIRDATLIGNGPEVLRSIDRVGRDLGYGVGTCGKEGQGVPVANAQPTLRIPRITVGGTAAP